MNDGLVDVKGQIDEFGLLLSDLTSVKSEEGRSAMMAQCASGLKRLGESLDSIVHVWRSFDSTLSDYRYRFRKGKKELMADLPGQQIMDFAECPSSDDSVLGKLRHESAEEHLVKE